MMSNLKNQESPIKRTEISNQQLVVVAAAHAIPGYTQRRLRINRVSQVRKTSLQQNFSRKPYLSLRKNRDKLVYS